MKSDKILLKLGGLKHLGEARWRGALTLFDEIVCMYTYREPEWYIKSDRVKMLCIQRTLINRFLTGTLARTKYYKPLAFLNCFFIFALRVINHKCLRTIKQLNPKYVLCSYGDYDHSDLVMLIAMPVISAPIIRAYKETRVEYNYLEYHSLKKANKVVLYDIELKKFLEKKYGGNFFDGKDVIVGYDENALPSCIIDNIKYQDKLSDKDNKIHLVILSFRVDSSPNRDRDENRYYYIDVIKKIISEGIVVHLHCSKYNDYNGENLYKKLADEYPQEFFMEEPLCMRYDSSSEEWINSCEILSRYDIGLIHNIVNNSSVSEFDKINVPHRFFAYEAAHVIPIIQSGENCVFERMFAEKHCGLVYDSLNEIVLDKLKNFNFYVPTYEEYLKAIFGIT